MSGYSAHRPVAGAWFGIHCPGLLMRDGCYRCRLRGVLLGSGRGFGAWCWRVRCRDGLGLHGSPENRWMGHRLPAYRRCGRSDRLGPHLRLLDSNRLGRRIR